jgi:2,5-furandicarboxylate decarboxylase 1
MPKDMRTWIAQLEAAGELARVERPVNPLTQMGALLWQSRERALLFEELSGFPGWRGLGQAPANWRQTALALGVPVEQVVPWYARKLLERLPAERVSSGPVKEVVQLGDQVDLTRLPVHVSGSQDGAPFFTSAICVTRDPDSGALNASPQRLQVKGPRRSGILLPPSHHNAMNFRKYEQRGEPMPIAAYVGHHPAHYLATSTSVPYGVDEYEIAGAVLGEPVRLVPCETVDLEVPCDAEIVLEGRVLPGTRELEGPYAEFQEYYLGGVSEKPVVEWTAVTMRHDAIFKHLQNGSEVEGGLFHKIPIAALTYNRLKDVGGYADVRNVVVLPAMFGIVVQMRQRFHGEARRVLLSALSTEHVHAKIAVAVDEDVDPYDLADVWWAINTRVHAAEDVVVVPGVRVLGLDPSGERRAGSWERLGSALIIDATRPPECDPGRKEFERARPMGDGLVRLEDFLGALVAAAR